MSPHLDDCLIRAWVLSLPASNSRARRRSGMGGLRGTATTFFANILLPKRCASRPSAPAAACQLREIPQLKNAKAETANTIWRKAGAPRLS